MIVTGTRQTRVETALGEVTLVADGDELTGLYFPGHWHLPEESTFGARVEADEDDVFVWARAGLEAYLAGERQSFDVPVRTEGDAFSERVWAMLTEIPYGATTTYGALAERLGDRRLAQRVGQAVGRNPLCVFIPCHRVVGADGSLTGYAGGLERKRWLLELEEPPETADSRLFQEFGPHVSPGCRVYLVMEMNHPCEQAAKRYGETVLRPRRAVPAPGADADDAWSETFLDAKTALPALEKAA